MYAIRSYYAPDYEKQGPAVIPEELKYVEVISVTASSGYDANQREDETSSAKDEEKELPSTVTLLVSPAQGNILAELEVDGKSHLSLVYRGDAQKANRITSYNVCYTKLLRAEFLCRLLILGKLLFISNIVISRLKIMQVSYT